MGSESVVIAILFFGFFAIGLLIGRRIERHSRAKLPGLAVRFTGRLSADGKTIEHIDHVESVDFVNLRESKRSCGVKDPPGSPPPGLPKGQGGYQPSGPRIDLEKTHPPRARTAGRK